ncbi:ammonia monooxygenase AbrB [Serratia plymuthica A30]|jgi:membrane AbrB-like protein|uniref:AbrB family transcriptional regulator n=2 Tax=Serratia plymuthica TaxID=82996 RepID=A0A318NZ05_SERPL|nr:AbrB family transcriptional regulator [Serratia plymuthica]AGO53178.1 protein AbrB [Serratia plymuthica 4Rx13]ANJ93317.1 AbrB family transcriptional regulator [Serratia plymuthica]EKF66911.1 ammonia monooxygenase AbrB [Serratia plymuthica A30]MBI6139289.1 AbrB family transcriptional regulator [Serratia plymuthica]PYD37555.1 AbrB family transcriptional regulator [Serratia plymuthica]
MEKLPRWSQWLLLLLASLALGFGLQTFHIPAALLLGPMIVGVAMGLLGATVRIPTRLFIVAQAVLGCMIAQSLSPAILTPLLDDWPLVLLVLFATLAASGVSGWCLVRFSELPGPTGAWGSSPGGASAMVAMAGDFGADVRLVAFMQYLRVLFVATAAAMVARIGLGDEAGHGSAALEWFPPLDWRFLATLGIAVAGAWLGPRLRIPSGALLLPMIIGAALHSSGAMALQVPEWLLALAYTLIGWSVGLRFTRPIFLLALRTLPQMVASIAALMLFCGLLAWMLTRFLPVDLMTAYLATSPGGLDTVAIIAAGSRVDMSFVMAMQTLRLFTILLTGPAMARFISNRASPAST